MATVTREGQIREARRLRSMGWKAPKIASFLGAKESTIRNWYLGGDCADCGAPVDGSSGSNSSRRCPGCAHTASIVWTREGIIAKFREWADRFGEPPTSVDWNVSAERTPERAAEFRSRWSAGEWPSFKTVQERFGSWNGGIKAAGFATLATGKSRHQRLAA